MWGFLDGVEKSGETWKVRALSPVTIQSWWDMTGQWGLEPNSTQFKYFSLITCVTLAGYPNS